MERTSEEEARIFNLRTYANAVNGPLVARGQAPVVWSPPLSPREIEDIKTDCVAFCIKATPPFCAVVSPFVTIAGIVMMAVYEPGESAHSTGMDMTIVSAIPTFISVCCLVKSMFNDKPRAEQEKLLVDSTKV